MEEDKYTTVSGDTWDVIAKKVYGNERYTDYLMQNNMDKLDIFIFDDGIELYTPEIEEEVDEDLPEWRR